MSDQTLHTDSGIPVKEVYTGGDVTQNDHSLPGQYPYTRGVPTMYRGKALDHAPICRILHRRRKQ